MTDIWTKRILIMFGGICGGAYFIPLVGILSSHSFTFPIAVFAFLASVGLAVFVSFVFVSPNRQIYLKKIKTRKSLCILSVSLIGIAFAVMFASVGINPILHAMYSEEYMQKKANESDIVQKYHELYPESTIRFVDYPATPPAIVFEMKQDDKMVRLMVGGFEQENLGYGFSCSTVGFHEDIIFYVNVKSTNDITDNVCFTKFLHGEKEEGLSNNFGVIVGGNVMP